jgi:hypothetical protein
MALPRALVVHMNGCPDLHDRYLSVSLSGAPFARRTRAFHGIERERAGNGRGHADGRERAPDEPATQLHNWIIEDRSLLVKSPD